VAAGVWTITELRRGPQGASEGETFVWSADTSPPTPNGGGRCAPKAPWTIGGQMRQKRTDYPNSRTPSAQILGPVKKPQTLEGAFDDRYNFAGFAVGEMRRLEAMMERGNLCRISFQDQTFLGIFVDWDFPYRRKWQIGYVLQFDVHERPENFDLSDRVPDLEMSPAVMFDALDRSVQGALEFSSTAPRSLLAGTTVPHVDAKLARMATSVDQLAATLDNREILPPEHPVDGFTRLGTQFREVKAASYELLLELGAVRSDTALAVQTAIGVLDFEDWTRSLRYAARLAIGRAVAGDRACSARAEPDAVRLYRPQAGESLYAISRKFYGTPHAWRLIYDRNHLTSVTLTGDEVLIIPERGQG
jgi:hypothetical protein